MPSADILGPLWLAVALLVITGALIGAHAYKERRNRIKREMDAVAAAIEAVCRDYISAMVSHVRDRLSISAVVMPWPEKSRWWQPCYRLSLTFTFIDRHDYRSIHRMLEEIAHREAHRNKCFIEIHHDYATSEQGVEAR